MYVYAYKCIYTHMYDEDVLLMHKYTLTFKLIT